MRPFSLRMSGGLKANSVWASFGVTTGEWSKGLGRMVNQTERALKQIEGAANKMGGIGLAWAAGLGASVKVAADHNAALKTSLDDMKGAGTALAIEIGTALQPAVQALADGIKQVVGFVQSLNPELKEKVGHLAAVAAGGMLAAAALGKIAGLAGSMIGLGKIMWGLAAPMFALLLPAIKIAAVIAGIILVVGLLRRAWDENWAGIQEKAAGVLNFLGKGWEAYRNYSITVFETVVKFFAAMIKGVLDLWTAAIRKLSEGVKAAASVLDALGMGALAAKARNAARSLDGMAAGSERLGKSLENWAVDFSAGEMWTDLVAGAKTGFDKVTDLAGVAAGEIAKTFKLGVETIFGGLGIDKLVSKLKGVWEQFQAGGSNYRAPAAKREADKAAKAETKKVAQVQRLTDVYGQITDELVANVLGQLGTLGNVIGKAGAAFKTQFAQTGDLTGAAIAGATAGLAVIAGKMIEFWPAVFARTEHLSRAQEVGWGSVLDFYARMLDTSLAAVFDGAALVKHFGEQVFEVMRPTYEFVGWSLKQLLPTILVFGNTAMALWKAMLAFDNSAVSLVASGSRLFDAVKSAGVTLLSIAKGFFDVWNAAVAGIQWVFDRIKAFSFKFGDATFAPFAGLGLSVSHLTKDTTALAQALADLNGLTFEAALAQVEAIAATERMGEAAQAAAEALLNVPGGYKVAFARFANQQAAWTDIGKVPAYASGGVATRPHLAMVGDGGEPEVIAPESMLRKVMREEGGGGVTEVRVFIDSREITARVERSVQKKNFHRTGSRLVQR